jgi:NTP pyrophosphatase (non-canonical NTP hydrolase)
VRKEIMSIQQQIILDVLEERSRQNKLHPEPLGNRAMYVFAEELGEYAKAHLEGDMEEAKKELKEAIAVLVRLAEEIEYEH